MAKIKENDYGTPTPYDPNFKGPLEKRSCTDIICFLIFAVFIACWIFIGYFAFTKGDVALLLNPKDSDGNVCGVDSNVVDKPYLFFFDLTKCIDPEVVVKGCPTQQVCVSKCPTDFFSIDLITNEILYNSSYMICINDLQPSSLTQAQLFVQQSKCASWYLPSSSILGRCVPTFPLTVNSTILDQIGLDISSIESAVENIKLLAVAEEMGYNIISDYSTTWKQILIGLAVSVVVCIIYIAIMRWIAGVMVWLSILGVLVLLGLCVYISVDNYVYYRDNTESATNLFAQYISSKNVWLALLIVSAAAFAIIFLILLALRKRISLAIVLVKESSKAVSSVTASLFFPIFPWIFQLSVIVYGIIVALFLLTVGDPYYELRNFDPNSCVCTGNATNYANGTECEPNILSEYCHSTNDSDSLCSTASCHFVRIDSPETVSYFHAINILCFFWGAFFISAFSEMVLASTFATWYWSFNKARVPFFTVTVSLYRTCRYHLGTLAFGSLIITICRIIRVILEYIDYKLKKYDNIVTRAIMCCLKCFFWCLEKFLKFINRNAYIMCAIYGKNFCTSARRAFGLLMRNILRVVVLDKVTDFLFFLSKLLLSAGMGCLTYLYFELEDDSTLNYTLVPVLTVAISTYFIASIFFSVYTMAVDTVFLCFLEDCERNDGSREKPYYMSKQLMKIFGKKNKKIN